MCPHRSVDLILQSVFQGAPLIPAGLCKEWCVILVSLIRSPATQELSLAAGTGFTTLRWISESERTAQLDSLGQMDLLMGKCLCPLTGTRWNTGQSDPGAFPWCQAPLFLSACPWWIPPHVSPGPQLPGHLLAQHAFVKYSLPLSEEVGSENDERRKTKRYELKET